ncbi:ribosomal protein S30 family protein [Actinidia rufa]|uniref:Ribosomal protein S30 family protein n=1 Tax=Actinidia rufa TaxID=165716 RepID=A0A7J0DXR8_9ERIC|nr:ribosomal protein S30 family protein [Actinidia rufa]
MGKVHGSLARAGKVRGQTPKVAKQDKKKKPRGRAHKRMQHNRRFVTAAPTRLPPPPHPPLQPSFASRFHPHLLHSFLGFLGAHYLSNMHGTIRRIPVKLCFVGFGKKRGPNSSEK